MSEMCLLQLVVIYFAFVAMAAAQPQCDPLTEYPQGGECCKMCGPGTSMSSLGTCLEPQCQKCQNEEYQDKYTTKSKCQRQPYCDPNRNFQNPVHDPLKRTTCRCLESFHCSSQECITCVPHTSCKPGHGVKSNGSHSHDTVCDKCSEGTFSQNDSPTEACQKWTQCESGQSISQAGTDTSDNVCAGSPRSTVVVIAVLVSILVLGLVLGCLFIGKRYGSRRKLKSCIELCAGKTEEPQKEIKPLVMNDNDNPNPNPNNAADESMVAEHPASWDEPRTPEEVDDTALEITIETNANLTDNGHVLAQDEGKQEKSEYEPQVC